MTHSSAGARIRPALPDDAAALAPLFGELGYPISEKDVAKRFAQISPDPNVAIFVAEVDGKIAGALTTHALKVLHRLEDVAHITSLVVAGKMRGAGIGRELLRAAEEWTLARGLARMTVTTALHRHDAHKFYEKCGFEFTGRRYAKLLKGK
jgi:GNAT superfamily N-acetyltransferase